jgi:hypothetical protein
MKPSQVAAAIETCRASGDSLMIWGPAGVGKSETVKSAAMRLGIRMMDFRAVYRESIDIMGLPNIREGHTVYAQPAGLPLLDRDGPEGILFIDEIVSAPPQTQAALYQLTLEGKVGDYEKPPGWQVVAAGNRMSDRGVVHRMPDPLVDRFFHVDFEPNLTDWCVWALGAGIASEVIAFLRFRPGLLHHYESKRECHAFTTPRGWAAVSRILGCGPEIESQMIRGRVGDGAAGEFMAFLKLCREMISPDVVLANPRKWEVPKNAGVLYALAEALARRSKPENWETVLLASERMPREYAQCLVSSAVRINTALSQTHAYIAWAAKHGSDK